jgi:peptide/nickel transport system ATP-binding protein
MPSMDPNNRTQEAPVSGDPPNPIDPPSGCRFHPRCKMVAALCAHSEPAPHDVGAGHLAACHLANPESGHPRLAAA